MSNRMIHPNWNTPRDVGLFPLSDMLLSNPNLSPNKKNKIKIKKGSSQCDGVARLGHTLKKRGGGAHLDTKLHSVALKFRAI